MLSLQVNACFSASASAVAAAESIKPIIVTKSNLKFVDTYRNLTIEITKGFVIYRFENEKSKKELWIYIVKGKMTGDIFEYRDGKRIKLVKAKWCVDFMRDDEGDTEQPYITLEINYE